MKKLLNILLACGLVSAASLSLSSCGSQTMKVAILNSRDPIKTIAAMKPLEKAISKKLKGYNKAYNIKLKFVNTGDYEAGAEALRQGTAAFSYMSMETYLSARTGKSVEDEGLAAPLVIVQTDAFKADYEVYVKENKGSLSDCLDDFKGDDKLKLLKKYNEILNSAKQGDKFDFKNREDFNNVVIQKDAEEKAQYYRSFIYAGNKLLEKANFKWENIKNDDDYQKATRKLIETSLQDTKDKKNNNLYFSDNIHSLSGSLYPMLIMNQLGFGKNNDWDEFKKIIKERQTFANYPEVAGKLAKKDNEIIAFGFSDIRREVSSDAKLMNGALENSTVIGVSEGIHEAGIHYSKVWMKNRKKDYDFVQALRRAFKELMDEGNYKEAFGFYNHTSYEIPDADNDAGLEWEKEWDKRYFKSNEKLDPIRKLVNDVKE